MLRLILITIFSMMMFTGCNSKQAELSPISKVSADFTTGTATAFPGGLIVVGVRQDANEKVSFAFPTGDPEPIIMERGDWNFYSMGYSGTQGDGKDGKFAGLAECGLTSIKIRGGERKAINLNLKSDGCSGKLQRDLKLQKIVTDACGVQSYFDNTSPYKFLTAADGSPFACGNTPEDQVSNVRYYKIVAVNSNNGVVTDGFSSPCLDEVGLGTYLRKVPTAIAPIKLKLYRSLASCTGDKVVHNSFYFPDGLKAGDPSNFQSYLAEDYVPGVSSRLYLPEAHTKKYHSPFLNIIPRFMCTTPDCFVSPLTMGRTASVDWSKPTKDQLIIADINGNYTCDDFSHYSNGFGISDCKIRNNSLYGTISRNKLTCLDITAFPLTYEDIYERNGFVYVLYKYNGNMFVGVLTEEGVLVTNFNLGPDMNNKSVAAADNGDFFVANPTSGTLTIFRKIGTSSWSADTSISFPQIGVIEVSPDGRYLFHAQETGYRINTYDLVNNVDVYTMPADAPQYVRKLQYVDGKLYAQIVDDPFNDKSDLYRYRIVNGVPSYEANLLGGLSTVTVSFHISNGLLNYLTTGYAIGTSRNYETAMSVLELDGVNGPSGSFVRMVDDIVVVNNTVYGIQKDFTDLLSLQWAGGLFVQPAVSAGECSDTFSVLLGGQVVGSHTIVSKQTPDDTELSLRIFEAGDKLVGKKSADNKSYFKSLNEEQTRNTTGALLSLPQRLLGPHGVGGMLSEYADCNAVKLSANLMPINKVVGVTDPYRGYQSFMIKVVPNTEVIPKFMCNDGVFNDAACTNQYDIKIKVSSTGLLENETYIMKLQCTSLVGQLDYRNTNQDVSWKQQVYWNTTLTTKSRVDSYKIVKSDDHDIFETALAYSTGSFIRARSARKDFWTDYNTATILDYEHDFGTTNHYTRRIYLGGLGSSTPGAVGEYGTYRTETDYTGNGDYCLDVTESNPTTASVGLCTFDNILPDRVKPSTLSFTAIENEFSFDANFSTFP